MSDILAAIDLATGCQQCGGPLGDSPSDDFCCESHRGAWHAARADELVGYVEPYERPEDFPGIRDREYRSVTFRLPRSTSNLRADFFAAAQARNAARTPAERAAVALRMESLRERLAGLQSARAEEAQRVCDAMAESMRPAIDLLKRSFTALAESLRNMGPQLNALAVAAGRAPVPTGPRERALHLRRTRNTGPDPRHRRAPRRIDAPRAR